MYETRVKEYYTGQVRQEWRRLVKDAYHRLELNTTLHFLEKHMPPAGLILDAGGGPGRYTLELARRGYRVVLLDLTPANLAFARRNLKRAGVGKQVAEITEGSIVDLSRYADGTFDSAVCLGGPLSHILDARARDQALSELIRVTRTGGVVAVSVMSRLSLLIIELAMFQHEIEMPHFREIRDTGVYPGQFGFTACHFFLPEELRAAFDGKGVVVEALVGLEGLGSHHRRAVNRLAKNETRWANWLETHYQTCTHPTVVGLSEHMLVVARKL